MQRGVSAQGFFSRIPAKAWTIHSLVTAFTATLQLRHLDAVSALAQFSKFQEEDWSKAAIKTHLTNIKRDDYLERFYHLVLQDIPGTMLADWLNNFIACASANIELSLQYIAIVTDVLTEELTRLMREGDFTISTNDKGEIILNRDSPLEKMQARCQQNQIHPLSTGDFPCNLNFSVKNGTLILYHADTARPSL